MSAEKRLVGVWAPGETEEEWDALFAEIKAAVEESE